MLVSRIQNQRIKLQSVLPPTPGPELIVDPNFATPADWTPGPSVSVSGGAAHWTSAAFTRSVQPNPALTITAGATYRMTFTISAISSGSLSVNIGGTAGTGQSSPGTYSQDIVAGTTANALIRAGNGSTTADVTNFSVKLLS